MNDNKIELKGIIWEDFVNYRKICTTLMFPKCDFKCDRECGKQFCQNKGLAAAESQWYDIDDIMTKYMHTYLSDAIVLQGLEPLDSLVDVYTVAAALNKYKITSDLVIYTGYDKSEVDPSILDKLSSLVPGHLIIKWGRFIPNKNQHFDSILGVTLASNNQYGEIIK